MSSFNLKKSLAQKKTRSYLNRDFESFKAELLRYARTYYPDQIQDFSDASLGGMFNDLVSYVGDVMSFYSDHQFNETNIETAVEPNNIERLIRLSGVKITGASPAQTLVDFSLKVEAEIVDGTYRPKEIYLPTIRAGTKIQANSGIIFELTQDLDFAAKVKNKLIAKVSVDSNDASGNPSVFKLTRPGLCVSGETVEENFTIPNTFIPFRTITLSQNNISQIIRVIDSDLNEYYEVDTLSNDVVYKKVANSSNDAEQVPDNMYVVPAPYRFITRTSLNSANTTLVFGSGRADTIDDDVIPDPSEVALPLYGDRKTFSKVAIDPNSLLNTNSLGVSPVNTTITVRYRSGGGINHNVAPRTIRTVATLSTKFQLSVPQVKINAIRTSIEVNNPDVAVGGENIPTQEEFRNIAISYRNSQSRIVTRQDLIARVYSMPPNFGRVYRVGTRSNPTNPLSSLLYIVSRNSDGNLVISPDSLKSNLSKYLNEFRLTSDAYDIIDAQIVNFKFEYSVVIDNSVNKATTISTINKRIENYLNIKNFQIDQPIVVSDLLNLILNQDGVISLERYRFTNLAGNVKDRTYSEIRYNLGSNTMRGMINPPAGGIFELKYPNYDIIGNAL